MKIFISSTWLLVFFSILVSCAVNNMEFSSMKTTENGFFTIPVSWFEELKGDFSFAKKWDYSDGIEINDYQQIICWKCAPRAQKMLDKRRKIIADSIEIFYKIIDSTRHYYSLDSRSTIVNMKESHYIKVKKYGDFTIEGFTKTEDSVNCSLFFRLKDDFISSWIYLKDSTKKKIFNLKEGKFFADKRAFERGILKANFSFVYQSENSFKALYWSGKIYAKISGM
jgi:hypothetical protein